MVRLGFPWQFLTLLVLLQEWRAKPRRIATRTCSTWRRPSGQRKKRQQLLLPTDQPPNPLLQRLNSSPIHSNNSSSNNNNNNDLTYFHPSTAYPVAATQASDYLRYSSCKRAWVILQTCGGSRFTNTGRVETTPILLADRQGREYYLRPALDSLEAAFPPRHWSEL